MFMEYKASLDTLAKGITIGVFILLIVIGQKNIKALLAAQGDTTTILIHSGTLLFFVVVLLGSWLYAPQSYTFDTNDLYINRPIGNVKFKLDNIKEIRIVPKHDMEGTIRTFGVGGLWGYYGKYHNAKIGNFIMYATQRKNKVLISTKDNKRIIITPDSTELVDKILEKIATNYAQ